MIIVLNSWLAKLLKRSQSALASLYELVLPHHRLGVLAVASPCPGQETGGCGCGEGMGAAEVWSQKALRSTLIAHRPACFFFKQNYIAIRILSWGCSFTLCINWVWLHLLKRQTNKQTNKANNSCRASSSVCHETTSEGMLTPPTSLLVHFLLLSENVATSGNDLRKPKARFCLIFMFAACFVFWPPKDLCFQTLGQNTAPSLHLPWASTWLELKVSVLKALSVFLPQMALKFRA